MFEKIVDGIYITGGIVLIMIILMAITSCGSTRQMKKCCKETVDKVYKYEKEYINE